MRTLAAFALILIVSGCGARSHSGAGLRQRGRTVFTVACAGCHTVTGHDTPAAGGDLAIGGLSIADIESFVRVMPVRLSPTDVAVCLAGRC